MLLLYCVASCQDIALFVKKATDSCYTAGCDPRCCLNAVLLDMVSVYYTTLNLLFDVFTVYVEAFHGLTLDCQIQTIFQRPQQMVEQRQSSGNHIVRL